MDIPEFIVTSHHQRWKLRWHRAAVAPLGKRHGSLGLCVTATDQFVMVSKDNVAWEFPAGRPEAGENWEQTLRREMLEEACASVTDAHLLGFSQGECIEGSEQGLVLVRSIWLARVVLHEWAPQSDERFRTFVTRAESLTHFSRDAQAFWNCVFEDTKQTVI